MAAGKTVAIINVAQTQEILHHRIRSALNEVIHDAYDLARKEVPVRKIFRYGRNKLGDRIRGRQDVRTLSIEEALGEQKARSRMSSSTLGMQVAKSLSGAFASAFPTDRAGRRVRGSAPTVKTTQLTGDYRSHDRANKWDQGRREVATIEGVNRIVSPTDIYDDRGRYVGQRLTPRPDIEADLSTRGRYELERATPTGTDKLATVGGALRKSIQAHEVSGDRRMVGHVTAGGEGVDYAWYVEFGTRRSRAQPFMRPAKALAREKLVDTVRRHLSSGGS
jgi:HK97 gp10 family phage protein